MSSFRRLLSFVLEPRTWSRPFRLVVLVLGLWSIVWWQRGFFEPVPTGTEFVEFDRRYTITASRGVQSEPKFYFFLRHLGLYPVMSLSPLKEDTKAEAERHLRELPKELRMDEGLTFRSGDRGRTYLYFVSTWFNGAAIGPSLIPASYVAFTAALCALFAAFWYVRLTPLGAGLVILLGSNPFQIMEVYQRENVFGWPIISATFLLALHVPLMVKRPNRVLFWAVPVVAAIWLATIKTVRSEGSAMIVAVLAVYAFAQRTKWTHKLAAIALFLAVLKGAGKYYDRAMVKKFEQTQAAIRAAGGVPFEGPLVLYHEVWPAIWGGLGDFDTTYGYVWEDRTTYAYALPLMKSNYGVDVPHWDPANWSFDPQNDYQKIYPYFFLEAPHYQDVLKEKVLYDIRNDPGWYLGILKKRVWRILTEATPITITTHTLQIESQSPFVAIACIPLMLFLLATRRWTYAKLLFFMVPLSATAIVVYSGGGTPNYSCFHLVGAIIFAALAVEGARAWLRVPSAPAAEPLT